MIKGFNSGHNDFGLSRIFLRLKLPSGALPAGGTINVKEGGNNYFNRLKTFFKR
jgi:hypothetical protein